MLYEKHLKDLNDRKKICEEFILDFIEELERRKKGYQELINDLRYEEEAKHKGVVIYRTQNRQSGDSMDDFDSIEAVTEALLQYRREDTAEGIWDEKVYEVVGLNSELEVISTWDVEDFIG